MKIFGSDSFWFNSNWFSIPEIFSAENDLSLIICAFATEIVDVPKIKIIKIPVNWIVLK